MRAPSRLLRLPLLAVLLPCLFIAVLSSQWLTLEREAAAHRDAEAAQRLAADLRRDLFTALGEAAESAVRAFDDLPAGSPLFHRPPPASPLIAEAFLFDSSGDLVAPPDERTMFVRTIERSRRESGRSSSGPVALAASHLEAARRFLAAGDRAAADRHAREIPACCADARDEHGVSYALYAAWLRVVTSDGRPSADERIDDIARELSRLVDEGHLGAPDDAIQLAVLAARADGAPALMSLVSAVERVSLEADRRAEIARLAAHWVSHHDSPAGVPGRVLIKTLTPAGSVAALIRLTDGRAVVMLVDDAGVERWIRKWTAGHDTLAVDVRWSQPVGGTSTQISLPLFLEASAAATLIVAPQGSHPDTERRRRHLFVAAVTVVMLLTVFLGYLAARDVSRELDTAALRSTFVASVTHELKTPLASIRLLAETMRQRRTPPEATGELLDTIVEETDRLSRLVDNVLSSSRLESGTRAYSPEPVSLTHDVRAALGRFDYVLKRAGFEIDLRVPSDALDVHVDRDAFGQALLNLLENAVKYSGRSRHVRVSVERRGGRAVVAVADEGIGIAEAVQSRIFDSFYRVPDVATEITGAGLGLALVRHFAEAHGGEVTVESKSGVGSVFSIMLPLRTPAGGTAVQADGGTVQAVEHG